MNDTINGDRMRQLRLATHATQTEISKTLNYEGNTLVSRLENGRGHADIGTAQQVARILDCTAQFLATPPADRLMTKPWLRAYADAPAKVVDSVVADNRLASEALDLLAVQRIPETIPRFHGDLNDPDSIEEHAELVRAAANLDDGSTVANVVRAAERLGCVVLPLSDELGRHLGLSQYVDGVPHIRVSRPRPNVPGDRQRFTVAHEVGHLSLHAHLSPPDTAEETRLVETQAHRFAGAFLTPRDALIDDLHRVDYAGRVTLHTLQELKSVWGVAIKMLVVRFQQLNVIDAAQATALYKQISKRGWNGGEPVAVGHEEPIWLSRALAKRWPESAAVSQAAHTVGLGESHFTRWLEWAPVAEVSGEVADVVSLDRARNGSRRSPSRGARQR